MEWYKAPFHAMSSGMKAWYWLEQNISKFDGDILFWNIGGELVRVILKDKKDLNTLRSKGWSKDGYKIIGSQDEINRDLEVEVLSVKFSKIGQKTFDAYPNLKWIICRSHGYDNVRADLAEKYNVGIVCTNPNTFEVAEWICEKVIGDKVLLLGGGRIGKKFCEIYNGETFVVTSKTQYDYDIVKKTTTLL